MQEPLGGVIKVRYPNLLYITLINTDELKIALGTDIIINYYVEAGDPALMAEEYSTEMIQPEFTIELDDVIYTGRHRGVDKMDDNAIISWVFFGLAVLILGAMAIMYWVMKCRKRKMQL